MVVEVSEALRGRGIQPSAQRVAIAEYVLATDSHPAADQVWSEGRRRLPPVSRATVYTTLNRFVRMGLLRELVLADGRVVFDPNPGPHHHFIDSETGAIQDVPWEAVQIRGVERLRGLDVDEYQVVMRGRSRRARLEDPGS